MSDKPVDYLRLATDIIDVYEFDKPEDLATAYAAMAQAVALERIATLLESLLETYKDSTEANDLLRTARIWGS